MSFPSERRCAVRRRCKNPDTRPVHGRKQLSLHSLNWLLVQPPRTSCNPQQRVAWRWIMTVPSIPALLAGPLDRRCDGSAKALRQYPHGSFPCPYKRQIEEQNGTRLPLPSKSEQGLAVPDMAPAAAAEFHNREKIPATPPRLACQGIVCGQRPYQNVPPLGRWVGQSEAHYNPAPELFLWKRR